MTNREEREEEAEDAEEEVAEEGVAVDDQEKERLHLLL